MAQFQPGETPPGAKPINEAIAKEYQQRSAEARKRNRTLREAALAALQERTPDGHTKMEALILKAMDNHYKGKLAFRDLKDLAAILGEDVLRIQHEGIEEIGIRIVDTRKRDGERIVVNYDADDTHSESERVLVSKDTE